MIFAQAIAGAAAAVLGPTAIMLVAEHYAIDLQAKVLGWLSAARQRESHLRISDRRRASRRGATGDSRMCCCSS